MMLITNTLKLIPEKEQNDIVAEIRELLVKQKRQVEFISPFAIRGLPNIKTLQNRYNALVLKLSTKQSDSDILNSVYFRRNGNGYGKKK